MGIGGDFLEETKYVNMEAPAAEQLGAPPPPMETPFEGRRRIDLPSPDALGAAPLEFKSLVDGRSSVRKYAETPLSLQELSYLLWCTQGVKSIVGTPDRTSAVFRTVPSAGARHALETYVLANRVQGLGAGLYRFLSLEHQLGEISTEEGLADQFARACLDQAMVGRAAATFLWVAVPARMAWRYGERAYRYLYLDAGHACQNLYLAAESIDSGACAVAAFDDDQLNQLLGLNGRDAFVIYEAAVGKKLSAGA